MGLQNLLNAIQSDVSNGAQNSTPKKIISSSFFDPPVNVSTIDSEMAKMSTYDSLSFPGDRAKYYFHLGIRSYKRTNMMSVGTLTPHTDIYLPVPKQIVGQQTVAWGEVEVGMGTGAMLNAGGLVYEKLSDEVQKTDNQGIIDTIRGLSVEKQQELINIIGPASGLTIASLLQNVTGNRNSLISALAKMGISGVQAYMGVSPNQFVTVLMKGPEYRRIQLSWRLVPRNEAESKNIRKIIKTINNSMAPSTAANGLIFKYPDIFYCDFYPNSGYLYKFKPAALKSFQANYAPGGLPSFFRDVDGGNGNNPPEAVDINMEFLELEYWLSGDFIDSNDPRDVYGSN